MANTRPMDQILNYVQPFEGNHEGGVAPGEKKFGTPSSRKLSPSGQPRTSERVLSIRWMEYEIKFPYNEN